MTYIAAENDDSEHFEWEQDEPYFHSQLTPVRPPYSARQRSTRHTGTPIEIGSSSYQYPQYDHQWSSPNIVQHWSSSN